VYPTVNRILIAAKMRPGAERDVARIWAESDATSLPHDVGVRERSLYSLHDLYIQVIDFDRDPAVAMADAVQHRGFHEISEQLRLYIAPYSPTWRGPRDAQADRFYHWRPER
jgi:cyclase